MKNFTLLTMLAVSILFTACGEKTKQAAEESSEAIKEAVKEDTTSALEEAKKEAKKALTEAAETTKAKATELAEEAEIMADEAAAKTAELKASAQESISKASDELQETAETVKTAATEAINSLSSPEAYAKCKGCHGVDGKTVALGKSAVLAGQDKAALIASLNEYKAGTKNVSGMGALMKGQVISMSDKDFEAIAEYLSSVK